MTDPTADVFNAVYDAVIALFPSADVQKRYIPQPSAFPHVQVWIESNTANKVNLSLRECFSSVVVHVEEFDNGLDGIGDENVEAMSQAINKAMLSLGYRRTYSSPVPNYMNATISRKVERYSRILEN